MCYEGQGKPPRPAPACDILDAGDLHGPAASTIQGLGPCRRRKQRSAHIGECTNYAWTSTTVYSHKLQFNKFRIYCLSSFFTESLIILHIIIVSCKSNHRVLLIYNLHYTTS